MHNLEDVQFRKVPLISLLSLPIPGIRSAAMAPEPGTPYGE